MTRGEELSLIERAGAGDREGADLLIRAHQQSLFAYLLRMSGRPDVAEDMVQEAFVRVLSNLHRFDPRFRFSTWLFTIARRLYVNYSQRLKPAYDTDSLDHSQARSTAPAAHVAFREARANIHDALQAALLELAPEQREALILFHQLDWPIWLIAQHMAMPEGTVKSHLHRGRRKMRGLLERRESVARRVGEALA